MTYLSEVMADSPLVVWEFNETSGTVVADSSGNGRAGSYGGSPTLGGPSFLADGTSGHSAAFNGNSVATIAYDSSWMALSQITATLVIKPTAASLTGSQWLTSRWGSSAQQPWILGLSSGKLVAGLNGAQPLVTGATTLVAGTVYVVGLRANGTTLDVIVNGVVDGSVSSGGPTQQFGAPLEVARAGLVAYGNIAADTFALFGTALSNARLLAHYQAAFASAPTTGTLSATLPHLTGSASGAYGPTGSLAATLPSLTASAAGTYGPTGSVAATLPSMTASAAGTYQLPGTSGDMAATLPPLAGDLEGSYALAGQLAATLPSLTGILSGAVEVDAALAVTLPSLAASLAGVLGDDFLIATLPSLQGDIEVHAYPIVKVGTVRTNRANGIRLGGSAVVEMDAPLEDDPPNLTTTPIHIITPTVPAPTLVNGRPQ